MKSKKPIFPLTVFAVLALAFCAVLPCVVSATDTAYAAAGSYYSSITATKGKALLGQLHDLIVKTHTYYSSYNDCKSKGKITDPGSGSNTVMEFYTHIDIDNGKWDESGGWNREHVWAKSLSNSLWGTSGAGSDLHHIRPSEKDLNNSRGNLLYGEVSGGTPEYTSVSKVLGGHSGGGKFEPLDNVKGDVARIVMYVYTHYNNASNVNGTVESKETHGNLPITKIISAGGESGAWALLLKWNKLDPVDDIERNRNEAVYKIQGNRNPFIDNAQYAEAIWGNGTVEEIKPTSISLGASPLSLIAGQSRTLSVSVQPAGASSAVTWNSSNTAVATVSNGTVHAVSAGTAVITATSVADSTVSASVIVTVTSNATIDPDPAGINDFVNSVAAISAATTLRGRYDAINAAYAEYAKLSSSDKASDGAATAWATLWQAVTDYNEDVAAANKTLTDATNTGAYAICGVTLAALALVALVTRKFI